MGLYQHVQKQIHKTVEEKNPNIYSKLSSIVRTDENFANVVSRLKTRLIAAESAGTGLSQTENIQLLQDLGINVGLAGTGSGAPGDKIAGSDITIKQFTDLLAKLINNGAIK